MLRFLIKLALIFAKITTKIAKIMIRIDFLVTSSLLSAL